MVLCQNYIFLKINLVTILLVQFLLFGNIYQMFMSQEPLSAGYLSIVQSDNSDLMEQFVYIKDCA